MKKTWGLVATLAVTVVSCIAIGYNFRSFQVSQARGDVEVCLDGEICINEDEWLTTSIGAVDDSAAAAELLKQVNACEEKLAATRPDYAGLEKLTQCGIELAKCRGALEEARRK